MERLQEEGIAGPLSRSESTQERRVRRGAKLHNREKHLERSRPKSRGAAGKTSEGFVCDGLDKIFRTVSQGLWALGLCWVGEGHNSLERGCSYAQQEHIEGKTK